jgi:hypothetical protein
LPSPFLLSILYSIPFGISTTFKRLDFIHGRSIPTNEFEAALGSAAEYLKDKYPKLDEAHQLYGLESMDKRRYDKLCDLYRKNHLLEPMEVKVKTPEVKVVKKVKAESSSKRTSVKKFNPAGVALAV